MAGANDSAETLVRMEPARVFAWLADPRNASAWFASVRLEQPPALTPQMGDRWRFLMTRQHDQPIPMRLEEYSPISQFVWETEYPGWRPNLRWVFTLSAAEDGGARLALRIEQKPGVVGWPLVALASALTRFNENGAGTPKARAQRAIERARDAIEAAPPTAFIAYGFPTSRSKKK